MAGRAWLCRSLRSASSLTSQGMAEQRELKCLIAAGGTAGHVLPSLAVAEALAARGVKVTFAGSPDRAEARLVPEAGFEFDTFRVSGLPRKPTPALGRAVGQALRAPRACKRILRAREPDVVLGGGGYVAGPMVYAASRLGIPAALMEADAHLGLANRLAAPFAERVFLSFPIEGRDGSKYRVTGRPIPARNLATSKAEGRRVFDLPPRARVLLVFGGSQGAASLNEVMVEAFGETGPAVLHLSGERDFERLQNRVRRDGYKLVPFTDEFGAALAAADLVVARAGGSVWELAAAGKPAILVPYPFATADHQAKNARFFERAGGAITVPETELGRVADLARSLIGDPERLKEMGEAMKRVARPDAAGEIAEELIALAG
jgi:UDP-N-acetylglucosamine--N-acetylmuramyl-(pentapeptide) pyrophosphoryl-undecaprenol N-acetylglucosamine transferase